MNIKIDTSISNEYDDIHVIINAPVYSNEIQMIIDTISNISGVSNQIIGELNNNVYILPIENILCFYSDEKYNYCRTLENNYRIRNTLHELEEMLNVENWIRISNSCIINLNHTKCFDFGTVGSIVVALEDNSRYDVSKRKIKVIMDLLKNRRKQIWKK